MTSPSTFASSLQVVDKAQSEDLAGRKAGAVATAEVISGRKGRKRTPVVADSSATALASATLSPGRSWGAEKASAQLKPSQHPKQQQQPDSRCPAAAAASVASSAPRARDILVIQAEPLLGLQGNRRRQQLPQHPFCPGAPPRGALLLAPSVHRSKAQAPAAVSLATPNHHQQKQQSLLRGSR